LILSILFFSFCYLYSTELKIASYNVENLFDIHYDGTEYDRYIPYRDNNWTKKTLDIKLKNISEVICEIDADIIGLQEIENLNALKALQKSLKYYGCRYKYSAITHKKGSAIQVALLSKIPIKSSKDIVVKAWGSRNILESKFIIDKKALYIFVNHWNSKRSSESKRIKSAIALKKRLISLSKGTQYIILGDFNSNYNEYKRVKKTGINTVLNSMLLGEDSMRESKFIHYNLWLELLPYRRWSYDFYGNKQGLDAIILPYSLFDGRGIDYINDSFQVFKRAYMFTKEGFVNRWKYKKGKHYGVGYSDHLPIFALFSTKPYIFKKRKSSNKECKIGELYRENNSLPCLLKNVKIVSKKGRGATIADLKDKIFIYGLDKSIKIGNYYNIKVFKTKIYKGVFEIIDFSVILLDNG